MNIVCVPGWGCDYSEAAYYGCHHSIHIGPWLIFWGAMTDAELKAWDDKRREATP
jgi:hypothetical protein